ncbi:MAG: DUF2330 domain-containing protein [Patulibacter sp.]|nr:DUF2330 domain-containing protein [Patulibacter sp.]
MPSSSVRRPSLIRARVGGALVAALAVVAAPLALAPAADAGSVVYGATLDRETALVSARDGVQSTVLSIALKPDDAAPARERERPTVVVPVPADPVVGVLQGPAEAVFAELDQATAPRTVASETARQSGEDVPRPDPGPLTAYEATELPAGDAAALTAWLRRHDLTTSRRQARELRRYADAGWAFVALRLSDPVRTEQTLRPLTLEFASDRVRFPMRVLGAGPDPVSVALYVVGPHRVTATGFGTYHAGRVEDLAPTPSPDVQALLGGEFVTKLGMVGTPPAEIEDDVSPEQGVSDRLFRASTDYPFESEAGFATAPLPAENAPEVPFEGAPGWLWLVVVPGVVVLVGVVGLGLRWRSARRG